MPQVEALRLIPDPSICSTGKEWGTTKISRGIHAANLGYSILPHT